MSVAAFVAAGTALDTDVTNLATDIGTAITLAQAARVAAVVAGKISSNEVDPAVNTERLFADLARRFLVDANLREFVNYLARRQAGTAIDANGALASLATEWTTRTNAPATIATYI